MYQHLKLDVTPTRIKVFCCIVFGILLSVTTVMATEFVVLKSQKVRGYKIGDLIDGDTPIEMPQKATFTLITNRGQKIQVLGPLSGSLRSALEKENPEIFQETTSEDKNLLNQMAMALKTYHKESMVLRGKKTIAPMDPWQINTLAEGDQCALKGKLPLLWRSSANEKKQMKISAAKLRDETHVTFDAGRKTQVWPIDLLPTDAEHYRMIWGEDSKEHVLILHLLPDDLPTRAHVASQLAQNKCKRQAAQLLIQAEVDKLLGELIIENKF